MSSMKFDNISQLRNWLLSNDVNISKWGKFATKSMENLWEEISLGEAIIQDNPPRRMVKVVQIMIRNKGKVLIEGKQKRGSFWSHFRGYPPSEKIMSGETVLDAALRCVEEELLIDKLHVKILEQPTFLKTETRSSISFPGLYTIYEIYEIKLEIDELPNDTFWTIEAKSDGTLSRIQHQWVWVKE
jgi:ADP-ribose pyrophosphatase YjhB (NUDIX family)